MPHSFPLVTLQPITDKRQAWVALLLAADRAENIETLARVFDEFGLRKALGHLPCIVTVGDVAFNPDTLAGDRIVLCPPVSACTEPAAFGQLAELKKRGFGLMALGLPPTGATLFEGVTALALSCPGQSVPSGLGDWLSRLPGPHLALSAEQVACPGRCHFNWFVGDSPNHAHAAQKASGAPNRSLLLDLLAKVANDADSSEIEAVIKRDPELSYHLLKLVNSVGFALTHKIASFGQAITLLGRRQLQRWLQLLLYARKRSDDHANPLLPRAAFRAGLLESLCQHAGGTREEQDRAFMVGMFSLLDRLFGMPLAEVIKPLNLSEDVVAALSKREGKLGAHLAAIEAGEGVPGEALARALNAAGIANESWARGLAHASEWAVQVSTEA